MAASKTSDFCNPQTWDRGYRGRVAARVHEWTDGQDSPAYKVGSLIMAGHCVPKHLLREAADDIKSAGGRYSGGMARILRGWARRRSG